MIKLIYKKIKLPVIFIIFTVIVFLFSCFFVFSFSFPAMAQGSANDLLHGGTEGEVQNAIGLSADDPRIVVARIIRVFLGFLGIIAVVLVMYAGWLWMTSEGNEEQIQRAKRTLVNALIGLAIILSAFAIVTFILNRFLGGGPGGPGEGSGPGGVGYGLGALGSCTVEAVYPEPNQKEVPRNTAIIVTFKEDVDINTICNDSNSDGDCLDAGEYIIKENVNIFETKKKNACPGACGNNITKVQVGTKDNRTFVFIPEEFLGSPSEYIWHTVRMTNSITKTDGSPIFDTCNPKYLEWDFEVSNKVDLTPPKVIDYGVFPAPDNEQDTYSASVSAQATGSITVKAQPGIYIAPTSNPSALPGGVSNPVNVNGTYSCNSDGNISLSINAANKADVIGPTGVISGDDVSDNIISIGCGLTIAPTAPAFLVGESWTINNLKAEKQADTLTVGSATYKFGSGAGEIAVGGTFDATAANINTKLLGNVSVSPTVVGAVVSLTAKVAGKAGNNINIATSNTAAIGKVAMSGGTDAEATATVKDQPDKPKNAVVKVTFNEAMNPLTASGDADDVKDYIKLVNKEGGAAGGAACVKDNDCLSFDCTGLVCVNNYLAGKWDISNGYTTIEFITKDLCGVNGCGEQIFCLPGNSNIQLDVRAANFEQCTLAGGECAKKTPFTNCNNVAALGYNVCQNSTGENYPQADKTAMDGIMDACMNSLSGDRDALAEGPIDFFEENSGGVKNADNYRYWFWTSDILDLTPPVITAIKPDVKESGVLLNDPVTIDFSKIMMSSSLGTGSRRAFNGQTYVSHRLLNIWNFTGGPLGYWTRNADKDNSVPADNIADYTTATINHTVFSDAAAYRSQVGSGIRDQYQNCFKPSASTAGAGCAADESNPSCCNNTPTNNTTCP